MRQSATGPRVADRVIYRLRSPGVFAGGTVPYPGDIRLLSSRPGYVVKLKVFSNDYTRSDDYFVMNDTAGQRTVYRTSSQQVNTQNFRLSPNDQYLSVEQSSPGDLQVDRYPDNSKFYSVYTQLIDVTTAKPARIINGFDLVWD